MKYISTRGQAVELSAAQAIIMGMAKDGGLFVPEHLPQVNAAFVEELTALSYEERACKIIGLFLTDYTVDELRNCVNRAYGGEKFDTKQIAPVHYLDDKNAVLELWHGPTSAFKDMALQLLPQLMSTALKKAGEQAQIVILVATSGDTGKAALEGFKDVEQIKILVFYPENGVSPMQRLQMVTQKGGNVEVVAVDGNFDDAQTGVKHIFNDNVFQSELGAGGAKLSSANSINWGRLVPQIVYYFSAYADLLKAGKIKNGAKVNFVVPTGNFGNILAGFYAKQMGLPVHKLICASNRNNVLTDFLKSGRYDRNRTFYKTTSPSMDILVSSNLERLLYAVTGGDYAQVSAWMKDLNTAGHYDIGAEYLAAIQQTFWADWADDTRTAEEISRIHRTYGYTADTHTAVAFAVAAAYRQAMGDHDTMTVIVSTASPYKFNRSVLTALEDTPLQETDEFILLEKLHAVSKLPVPERLANLRHADIVHTQKCAKAQMSDMVRCFAIK